MNLEQRQQIEEKVTELNQKLKDSGIPQICFEFDSEGDLVQLLYKFNGYNEWVGSIVDSTPTEILDWLKTQETQFYLYKQLISYFGDGFAHAIIPNDSTVTLVLNRLAYIFSYDKEHLVVTVFKYYFGKDLVKLGSEVGELKLECVTPLYNRESLGTKVLLIRVMHETDLAENLDHIRGTFKHFEDVVVNQTVQIKEMED